MRMNSFAEITLSVHRDISANEIKMRIFRGISAKETEGASLDIQNVVLWIYIFEYTNVNTQMWIYIFEYTKCDYTSLNIQMWIYLWIYKCEYTDISAASLRYVSSFSHIPQRYRRDISESEKIPLRYLCRDISFSAEIDKNAHELICRDNSISAFLEVQMR